MNGKSVFAVTQQNETWGLFYGNFTKKVKTGYELEVHLLDGYVINKTQNQRYDLQPLGDVLPIIEAGGVFEYAKTAGMLK